MRKLTCALLCLLMIISTAFCLEGCKSREQRLSDETAYEDVQMKAINKKVVKCINENDKEGGTRCFKCYELRLNKAAQIAKQNGFDYFTTTLSISPHKNSQKLNEIGEYLSQKYEVKYLYADFKKKEGFKRSLILSKKYNLYRQTYCGCRFSKNKI